MTRSVLETLAKALTGPAGSSDKKQIVFILVACSLMMIQHRRSYSQPNFHLPLPQWWTPNSFCCFDFKPHPPRTSFPLSVSQCDVCLLLIWTDLWLHVIFLTLFFLFFCKICKLPVHICTWPLQPWNVNVCVCMCVLGVRGRWWCVRAWYEVYVTGVNGGNWVIRRGDTLPAVPGNDVLQLPPSLSLGGGNCNEL